MIKMVNEEVMDSFVDGLIDGLSDNGFFTGDGLERDEGSDDESDGEHVLRVFYLDEDGFEHKLKLSTIIEVEDIRDTNEDDD